MRSRNPRPPGVVRDGRLCQLAKHAQSRWTWQLVSIRSEAANIVPMGLPNRITVRRQTRASEFMPSGLTPKPPPLAVDPLHVSDLRLHVTSPRVDAMATGP